MSLRIKVSLDLERISKVLMEMEITYITVRKLADILGISTRTAGKIMSRLEALGIVERYSRRAYKVSKW